MPPFEQFDKTNLYLIKEEDYTLVVVGYPVWRGFVSAYTISELTGFKNCRVSDKLYSLVLEWIKTSKQTKYAK